MSASVFRMSNLTLQLTDAVLRMNIVGGTGDLFVYIAILPLKAHTCSYKCMNEKHHKQRKLDFGINPAHRTQMLARDFARSASALSQRSLRRRCHRDTHATRLCTYLKDALNCIERTNNQPVPAELSKIINAVCDALRIRQTEVNVTAAWGLGRRDAAKANPTEKGCTGPGHVASMRHYRLGAANTASTLKYIGTAFLLRPSSWADGMTAFDISEDVSELSESIWDDDDLGYEAYHDMDT
ncbi:uncharacterized protein BDR25DRAFT_361342 [Lindgomyces ingoldianus]|uniref:Uncharacterized protein n=1 Tax=Lindgomyces ingoldianus TaxID=673940 RepID=A0ACB6QCP8_9PLEO|nr:uncharacterized protein BDR25DRAFT_361342 [Lindgomyces ingoldianus]KAF2464804.1 hypothetical protein BDR25DRAFT_361342 [Lindgomyces ingoldianus]